MMMMMMMMFSDEYDYETEFEWTCLTPVTFAVISVTFKFFLIFQSLGPKFCRGLSVSIRDVLPGRSTHGWP